MNSMERRLQFGLALVLVALMTISWAVVNRSIHSLVENFVVSRLEHDAENMIAALEPDPKNTKVRWRRINDIYNKVNSGHYYVFKFADGRLLNSPSLWDKTLVVPDVPAGEEIITRTDAPAGQRVLLWAKHFIKNGQSFTLAVAEDLSPIKTQRQSFKRNFATILFSGFLALLVLQSWLVRRSFRRLNRVRDDIYLLEQGKRDRLTEDVPDEIRPLVKSFNHLLGLLTQRLERSRNSLGNLAHALKRPLNLLMQHLDTGDKWSDTDRRQASDQAGRIRQLIERELKRARMAGKGVSGQHFDAGKELPDLIDVLKQAHREKPLDIYCGGLDDIPLFGDREDMLELIGNVLDNACKWAKSKVRCLISHGNQFRIIIEDDGAGLSDEELDRLANRGVRMDETVHGSGLGLAISKDIISLYGGTLKFSRSADMGGLCVRISLPINVTK